MVLSLFKKESSKGKDYIKQKYGVEVEDCKPLNSDEECLFSIYDKVCEEYNPPFVSKNLKSAVRSIKESLKSGKSIISIHPEDYKLVKLGTFRKSDGSMYPCVIDEFYEISLIYSDLQKEQKSKEYLTDGIQN